MGWNNIIDATLLIHAAMLFYLAFIIFRAAYVKHNHRMWRVWPPMLLMAWGVSEAMDALVYLRRWTSQVSGIGNIDYYSGISFVLNVGSLIAIGALIARIHYGESGGIISSDSNRKTISEE